MTSGAFVGIRASLNGVQYAPAGVLLTVDGTAYPFAPNDYPPPGSGFSSDMAYALMNVADGLFIWEGIGYSALVTPMLPGEVQAMNTMTARVQKYPIGTPIFATGYSQGAVAVGMWWTQHVLDPKGPLYDRYLNGDIKAVYVYGDPLRCPGIANGNILAGQALPSKLDGVVTCGIAGPGLKSAGVPGCLTAAQTPENYYSFANDGDIYACAPGGSNPWTAQASPGKVGTSIFNVIQHATFFDVVAVAGDLFVPIGMIEEIINGLKFAAQGVNAPHWQYQNGMAAAVADMVSRGQQLPHLGC